MVPITIRGVKSYVSIYALIDEGSTVTLINSKIIHELGVKSSHADITLKGVGDNALIHSSEKINLELKHDNSNANEKCFSSR